RRSVRVLPGDLGVHIEEVTVFLFDHVDTMAPDIFFGRIFDPMFAAFYATIPVDSRRKVEIYRLFGGTHAIAGVATLFSGARGDVPRYEITKGGIAPLQVIVTFLMRNLIWLPRVVLILRHPDAAVIPQRLGHQRQLALMFSGNRNTRGVDLRIARIAEIGAFSMRFPRRRDIAAHGIGTKIEDIAIAAAAQQHGM